MSGTQPFYFGSLVHAGYVPAPNTDMDASHVGQSEQIDYFNGGAFVAEGFGTHREFNMNWGVQEKSAMDFLNEYRSGIHGKGLMYFVDPFAANAMPPYWARPELTCKGGPSLVDPRNKPTLAAGATLTNLATNPAMEAAGAAVTVRTNLITDPNATSTAGWGVSGTAASFTRTVDSTFSHSGTTSIKQVINATGQTGAKAPNVSTTFAAGEIIRWSFWIYSTKAGSITPYIDGTHPTAGSYIGLSSTSVTVPASMWTKVVGTVTAPANGVVVSGGFGGYNLQVTAGDTVWFDEFVAERLPVTGADDSFFAGDTTPATKNLALSATVTGVSTGERATDGSTDTNTYAQGGPGLTALTVDLGKVMALDTLKVWHYYGDGRTYYGTKTEVSTDALNWTPVFDSAVSGTYPESSAGKTHVFSKQSVRYIRDWLNGSSANTSAHWVEIQAFNTASDFTYAWTGTANASSSIQQGLSVSSFSSANTGTSAVAPIQSDEWSVSGKSLRIVPTGSGTDTSVSAFSNAAGLGGFVPGKTYTAMATLRLAAPQPTSGLFNRARSIYFTDSSNAWTGLMAQAPNTAGVHNLRLTFTVAANATFALIRLYNGAAAGTDVWWDNFLVVEGTYTGGYFDGNTRFVTGEQATWTGAADASTSTLPISATGLPNDGALYTINDAPNTIPPRVLTLLIPEDRDLWLGFSGSATNGGVVRIQPIARDGSYGTTINATLLSPTADVRLNHKISGSANRAVQVYLSSTLTGASTVNLVSSKAVYSLRDVTPTLTGGHSEGEGHTGFRFSGDGVTMTYVQAADGHRYVTTAASFVEVGAWA